MSTSTLAQRKKAPSEHSRGARDKLNEQAANELVFAVVGHVGSGTTTVARQLEALLSSHELPNGPYEVHLLKARREITEWARSQGNHITEPAQADLNHAEKLQNLGDAMRAEDPAAVARALALRIRDTRSVQQGSEAPKAGPVKPDGTRRAYIIDAIRHPTEAHLLRSVYRNAFALIGVVCDEDVRRDRLGGHTGKYKDAGWGKVHQFMQRDAKAKEKHGQRVSDAFHLSDYFLDNSESRVLKNKQPNPNWNIPTQLSRLVQIITHSEVVRPETHEMAMHTAYGAQMRSACMSRQVGAALVDAQGNIAATGTNEVPQAGGGLYGQGFSSQARPGDGHLPRDDHRCAYQRHKDGATPFCSNTLEQNEIIDELLRDIPQLKAVAGPQREELKELLRNSRIGGLIEFSRAVHAEMDALLSAARQGISTVGGRLFVTTFPCHYCARHIVAAGVDEVQFIEPYPKSKALTLHEDSITREASTWVPPSSSEEPPRDPAQPRGEPYQKKVLFRAFTGVAPRMYSRAFLKDRELKNGLTGVKSFGEPDWGTAWDISKGSYVDLEATLLPEDGEHHG